MLSEAEFMHSVCPSCAQKLYPEMLGKGTKSPVRRLGSVGAATAQPIDSNVQAYSIIALHS